MNLKYALNDLRRNPGVNLALLVVLALSSFLMATGAMVMERTVGAVNALFTVAQPPHFLQMHRGDYDPDALERFAAENPEIDAWLIEEMVGYDSAALTWSRPGTGESGELSESLIDNLFVTQNAEFDFLLDESGEIVQPAVGEIYVPVAYQQRFALKAGDELHIQTEEGAQTLTIAGFVRDSQMASSLSSATRFVIAEADFATLRADGGIPEIIVEYRLEDAGQASTFQTAYERDESLPKNGQAVTGEMIRMINAIGDGLVAVALMFASLLLIAIALLNVRFVIRGTLYDEVRQIGAMKAIGLPNRTISGLYLSKYAVMTATAAVVGGVLAIFATQTLTRGIQSNYAAAPVTVATVLAPVVALMGVALIVLGIARGVLRAINRIQVVSALVHGSTLDERRTARRAKRLARSVRRSAFTGLRGGNINRRLALIDLRAERGQWVLLPLVFLLAAVLMTLPTNLLTTFQSPKFVTYMGAPEADLRIDLQFTAEAARIHGELSPALAADDRLISVREYANELAEVKGTEGWESLRIEVGDYSGSGIEYLHGERPETGEIALSVLNADEYGVGAGDALTLRRGGETVTLTVSGIYQDVTSGGRTAKLQGEPVGVVTGYVYFATVAAGEDAAALAAEYDKRFPAAAAVPMREYVQQTLSYVTDAFASAAMITLVFALGVVALITSLFLGLRLSRERRRAGALSALGFSGAELSWQLRFKAGVAIVLGGVVGVLVAASLGELFVGAAISASGLGIASLKFIPNPLLVYVVYPLLLIAVGMLAATAVAARLRRNDTSAWLRA